MQTKEFVAPADGGFREGDGTGRNGVRADRRGPSTPLRKAAFFSLIGLLGCLAVSGCAVKPVPLTQQEINAQVDGDLTAMFRGQAPVTGPLTMDDAVRRAIAYNLEYRLKLMEEALAMRQLDAAAYDMLPRLSAMAGYSARNEYAASSSMNVFTGQESLAPSTSQDKEHTTLDLTLTWNVLDFGMSYFQAKQQADRSLIMVERRRKAIHTIVQQIRQTYWLALGAQELEGQVEPLLQQVKKALEASNQAQAERLRTPLEALSYRRGLLDTVRQIEAFRDELSQAKMRLASLMNLPPGETFTLAGPKTLAPPVLKDPLETMENLALTRRPELMDARLQERISAYETKKSIARLLPGIDLTFGPHYDSNGFLVNNTWIEGGARAVWNLLSILSGPSQYSVAKTQTELARMSRLALNMAVLTQLHVSYQDFLSRKRQFELADEIQELDSSIYEHTKNAIASGTQSELNAIKAATGTLFSKYRRYQNYAAIQNAYGQILVSIGEDPELITNQPASPEVGVNPPPLSAAGPSQVVQVEPLLEYRLQTRYQ